eukprot:2089992-Rhodomonas_salina.2
MHQVGESPGCMGNTGREQSGLKCSGTVAHLQLWFDSGRTRKQKMHHRRCEDHIQQLVGGKHLTLSANLQLFVKFCHPAAIGSKRRECNDRG